MSDGSNSNNTTGSRVTALAHLEQYVTLMEEGQAKWKASMWQLTKSRRNQNRGMLSMESAFRAGDIREEIRARTVVKQEQLLEPPELVEDHKTTTTTTTTPQWSMVDVLEERTKDKENTIKKPTATSTTGTENASETSGLRQRKHKEDPTTTTTTSTSTSSTTQEWTMVEELEVQEEELLLLDPLEFFVGLPPRELKNAQQEAKKALDFYVQAANQVAAILSQLPRNQQEQKEQQ
jgi:hypothetical protein